jgi:hypothetical protein
MFSVQAAFTHREAFAKFPWEKVSYRIIFIFIVKTKKEYPFPQKLL